MPYTTLQAQRELFPTPAIQVGTADSTVTPPNYSSQALPSPFFISPDTLDFRDVPLGSQAKKSFTVKNVGTSMLPIQRITVPGNREYQVLFVSTPFNLAPDSTAVVEILYTPRDTGCFPQTITVTSTTGDSGSVFIKRCVSAKQSVIGITAPSSFVFAATVVSACRDDQVEIINRGQGTPKLLGIYSDDPDSEYFESLVSIPIDGLLLKEINNLPFRFCPEKVRPHQATYRFVTDSGVFLVKLNGNGIQEGAPSHTYYLEPGAGHVGDPVTSSLRAETPLTETDSIVSVDITVQVDPKALILQAVKNAKPSIIASIMQQDYRTGMYRVNLESSEEAITGDTLLTLEFIGLSTGKPENRVELVGEVWKSKQRQDRNVDFTDGLIFLEGCTVGTSGLGRRVQVESLRINAAEERIVLLYTAPDATPGRYAIVDASGTAVLHRNTPLGTGVPQELHVSLQNFPPGLYGMQIEFGDDTVIVPFIHHR